MRSGSARRCASAGRIPARACLIQKAASFNKHPIFMAQKAVFRGQGRDVFATRRVPARRVAARAHVLAGVRPLPLRSFRHRRALGPSTCARARHVRPHTTLFPCMSLCSSSVGRLAPQLPTINDMTSPAFFRARRRYFDAPLSAHVETRGRRDGSRQRAVSTAIRASASQTFDLLASTSVTTGPPVVAWQVLLFPTTYIVCFFGCKSSSFSVSV